MGGRRGPTVPTVPVVVLFSLAAGCVTASQSDVEHHDVTPAPSHTVEAEVAAPTVGAPRALTDGETGRDEPQEHGPWEVVWETPIGGRPMSALGSDDERIVVITGKENQNTLTNVVPPFVLRAFDHAGGPVWTAEVEGNYQAPPVLLHDGSVVLCETHLLQYGPKVGTSQVSRYASSGEHLWTTPLDAVLLSEAAARGTDGTVYVLIEGAAVAVGPDGDIKWSLPVPVIENWSDAGEYAPTLSGGLLHFTQFNGVYRRVNLAGELVWEKDIDHGLWCGMVPLSDNTWSGGPLVFDWAGEVRWGVNSGKGCPTARGKQLFFGKDIVTALSNGEKDWQYAGLGLTNSRHPPTVAASGNLVILFEDGQTVGVLSPEGELLDNHPYGFKTSQHRWHLVREGLLVIPGRENLVALNATEAPDPSAWYAPHRDRRNTRHLDFARPEATRSETRP